jgi:hypothetical protein
MRMRERERENRSERRNDPCERARESVTVCIRGKVKRPRNHYSELIHTSRALRTSCILFALGMQRRVPRRGEGMGAGGSHYTQKLRCTLEARGGGDKCTNMQREQLDKAWQTAV